MESNSLMYYLNQLSDKRRAEGTRHKHSFVLILILMATMSRYYGYQGITRFIKKNSRILLEKFKPEKDRLPSISTVRRVIMNLDFKEFVELFHKWTRQFIEISEGDWVSLDGKSLKGTLADYSSSYQNFVSIVSSYVHKSDLVISIDNYENKKQSEIGVVESMISALGLSGVTFTMDALHCQKNSGNDYREW